MSIRVTFRGLFAMSSVSLLSKITRRYRANFRNAAQQNMQEHQRRVPGTQIKYGGSGARTES
jgi:hypothetical protein